MSKWFSGASQPFKFALLARDDRELEEGYVAICSIRSGVCPRVWQAQRKLEPWANVGTDTIGITTIFLECDKQVHACSCSRIMSHLEH